MSDLSFRILSDLHFGDRASRVTELARLRPLLAGAAHVVLNGDTLDTRPGPDPQHTAEAIAAVHEFFPREVPRVTYLSGNHDADFSREHTLDLAGGDIFVLHGDVLFDDIVPWSRDAPFIRRELATAHAKRPRIGGETLDERFTLFRRVAASIPQRHQSEKNPLKYALSFLIDTAWPPLRVVEILRAWRRLAPNAADFVQRHRPQARFVITGHTHRPGIWRMARDLVVINTGSYCPPLGGTVVDITGSTLVVRRVDFRRGEFHPGPKLAEFPLARA